MDYSRWRIFESYSDTQEETKPKTFQPFRNKESVKYSMFLNYLLLFQTEPCKHLDDVFLYCTNHAQLPIEDQNLMDENATSSKNLRDQPSTALHFLTVLFRCIQIWMAAWPNQLQLWKVARRVCVSHSQRSKGQTMRRTSSQGSTRKHSFPKHGLQIGSNSFKYVSLKTRLKLERIKN